MREMGSGSTGSGSDDARIRAAVKSGQAEPLKNILAAVRQHYPGEVVRIRLTGQGDKLLYKIRMIDPNNKLIDISVDAKTSRVVSAPSLY